MQQEAAKSWFIVAVKRGCFGRCNYAFQCTALCSCDGRCTTRDANAERHGDLFLCMLLSFDCDLVGVAILV